MGKNLKGKEIGKGIYQRKDGLYCARYIDALARRQERCFSALPAARKWLANEKKQSIQQPTTVLPDMTVDGWFEYWIDHIVGDLAPNMRRNYRERYVHNIQPVIGKNASGGGQAHAL